MELEIRTKEGIMIGKIKGKTALYQYQNLIEKDWLKAERKNLKTDSQPNFITYLVLTCVIDFKMFFGEMEIWIGKGDYIKIT